MDAIFSNPWIIGVGVTVIGGLVLCYFFGIGNERSNETTKTDTSPFVSAGGDITAGRDIFIGSKGVNNSNKGRTKSLSIYKERRLVVTETEPKNLILRIDVNNFKKISSRVSLINAENSKWRVGYIFSKTIDPKREYIFHVFQDSGSNSFHSRIVEREPAREIVPDIQKHQIGIEDTKNFELIIENEDGEMSFFVDGIPLGKCRVPPQEVSDVYIRAWSHGNSFPITVILENVRVW